MQPNGHPAHSNLYVKGLPPELEQGELQQLFQIFGAIESCRIVRDMSTGVSKGYGFVKFSAVQNAVDAIKGLHGSTLGASTVEVKLADVDIGPAPSGKLCRSRATAKGRVGNRESGRVNVDVQPAPHGRSTWLQATVDKKSTRMLGDQCFRKPMAAVHSTVFRLLDQVPGRHRTTCTSRTCLTTGQNRCGVRFACAASPLFLQQLGNRPGT